MVVRRGHDAPVRVAYREMKASFVLLEMIGGGVVNDRRPEGVFNVETLRKVHEMTSFASTRRDEDRRDSLP